MSPIQLQHKIGLLIKNNIPFSTKLVLEPREVDLENIEKIPLDIDYRINIGKGLPNLKKTHLPSRMDLSEGRLGETGNK